MAAARQSRKKPTSTQLKRDVEEIEEGDYSENPTVGIKKGRFVSPDYKSKHTIGRRRNDVVTYNETLLHYGVMANACMEGSVIKAKSTEKKSALKDEGKSSESKFSPKKETKTDSIVEYSTKTSLLGNFKKETLMRNSSRRGSISEESTKGVSAKEKGGIKISAATTQPEKGSVIKNPITESAAQNSTPISPPLNNSVKFSFAKISAGNSSVRGLASKDSKKGSVIKSTTTESATQSSRMNSPIKNYMKSSTMKISAVNNSLRRIAAKNSERGLVTKNSNKESVAASSMLNNSPLKTSMKSPSTKSCLKKTLLRTGKKLSSSSILKKKSPNATKVPRSIEDNLLKLNRGKKLSVCLIRLKREASLNAAAKVNLMYNENQQNFSGKQICSPASVSKQKMKDNLILKNCQLFKTSKSYKPSKKPLSPQKGGIKRPAATRDSKPSKKLPPAQKGDKSNSARKGGIKRSAARIDLKSSKKPISPPQKGDAVCKKNKLQSIEKSPKLLNNKMKDTNKKHDNITQFQNSSSSFQQTARRQILNNKTEAEHNDAIMKKPKWKNDYKCRKDCIACHIKTNDCQLSESYMKSFSISNSNLRGTNPDCLIQHSKDNKQNHFSSQLGGKCVKGCHSRNMKDYSSQIKLRNCFNDYQNLKEYNLGATESDLLSDYPHNYQNIKNLMRNHDLHFEETPATMSVPSNSYGSKNLMQNQNLHFDDPPATLSVSSNSYGTKGGHQHCSSRGGQEHCCSSSTITPDFYYNNLSLEEDSPGKRMASLNAQAFMDVCQESQRYSKRELFQNSQRAARTHYIFSPKRQSCRWVDGLGSNSNNSSSEDLEEEIIVTCTETSTNSSSSYLTSSNSASIPSGKNYSSPDFQGRKLKRKSMEGVFPANFSQFNDILEGGRRQQEMGEDCSSSSPFPFLHGDNVPSSSAQCQTFTLNGIGSITNLTSLPVYQHCHGNPPPAFSVPCSHGTIPHCGYYSSGSFHPQPIRQPCVIPSAIPIHVPHAQVELLIHNPHPNQSFIQTKPDANNQLQKSRVGSKNAISKNNAVDSRRKKNDSGSKHEQTLKSSCKLKKQNCDLKKVVSGKVEKTSLPSKQKKPISPSCGWSWDGEPEIKPVPNLNLDAPPIERKCYPAIKHTDGELIRVRDCVLLRSGPKKKDLPFTAKVVAFWENTLDGEMMMSLLWYYRPEHTETGRQAQNVDCEIFASKHRDINSVACIEEKCYVLTSNEYCRYKAEVRRNESNFPARRKVVPVSEKYPRLNRLPPINADPDTVFLCRKVYHFRQKRILKS